LSELKSSSKTTFPDADGEPGDREGGAEDEDEVANRAADGGELEI
jgi:hypothetical protein